MQIAAPVASGVSNQPKAQQVQPKAQPVPDDPAPSSRGSFVARLADATLNSKAVSIGHLETALRAALSVNETLESHLAPIT